MVFMAVPLARADQGANRSSAHRALILSFVLLGLLLRLYLLFRPGHLFGITEYDDGVYFGAALRLVQGIAPYKDYVLVQPPGIAVLLSPFAMLSKIAGTSVGFAATRLFTVAVDCANIALVGLLVRSRGPIAISAACGVMAVYPQAIASSQTVLLEPYLNFFLLVGFLLCFGRFRFKKSPTSILLAGIFLGLAGSVKAWAIIPAAVLFAVLFFSAGKSNRKSSIPLLAGTVAGFIVVVAPFFVIAPGAFVREVVLDQLSRAPGRRVSLLVRMTDITGANPLSWLLGHGSLVAAALSFAWMLVILWAAVRTLSDPEVLSIVVVAATILIFIALLWPNDFYYHYADFEAPFLAMALAIAVSNSTRDIRDSWAETFHATRAWIVPTIVLLFLATTLEVVYESSVAPAAQPAKAAEAAIPVGSCVVSDQVSLLIASNRFFSESPDCSKMLDPFGTAIALSGGKTIDGGAALNEKVVSNWLSALESAQYVWLTPQNTRRIPWTAVTKSYFGRHFRLVLSLSPAEGRIYRRYGA